VVSETQEADVSRRKEKSESVKEEEDRGSEERFGR
jgi:hypothetical protein